MAWNPFGVMLEIEATGSNVVRKSATQYTVKINASWETYYSGAKTNYGMKVTSGGQSIDIPKFSGSSVSSGSGSFTGTYSISGNGSQTKSVSVVFENYNDLGDSKTTTVTFNVTVPAWTSYTIKYNANGGSGAPSSQTKWKDQTLTLSSTKPTRTGYTFSKWNTKSDGSGTSYSSGSNYTANSATTLYAIWTEHKLTINYYSNYATSAFEGALNAVGSGKNVIVHTTYIYYDNDYSTYGLANYSTSSGSVYMTRTGYTATGNWGTSTSGGTLINENTKFATGQKIAEALGKSLKTGNASVNLYAQWTTKSYIITFDSSGGLGNMPNIEVDWNEDFTISNNTFRKDGYKFIGWNLYRQADSKYYAISQGWLTEDEINNGNYQKKIYQNQTTLKLDSSWIRDNETATNFIFFAVWEISGVIYIDNRTTFEPYLPYIDNGESWDLYLAYADNGTNWDIIS